MQKMTKKNGAKIFISMAISVLSFSAVSQNSDKGSVEINREARVDTLLSRHKQVNEAKKTIPGYRIQLYSGPQRTKATELKADFIQKYPDYPPYIVYQQPNFKLRVGDFHSRLEAFRLFKQLQSQYESAFIVKDEIAISH